MLIHEFIHATKRTFPRLGEILRVGRVYKNWLITHPPSLVTSITEWQDSVNPFGFNNHKRKEGDEHSLLVLPGAFTTRINVIIVRTSGHLIEQYNPPVHLPHSE